MEAEIAARKAEEARLRGEIAAHIRRLENAPRQQRTYQEISRDYQTRRDLYDSLRKRYEQAQLEEGQDGPAGLAPSGSSTPPSCRTYPAAPNRMVLSLPGGDRGAAWRWRSPRRCWPSASTRRSTPRTTSAPSPASRCWPAFPLIVTAGDRRDGAPALCLGALASCWPWARSCTLSHRFARTKVGLVAMLGRS